MVEKSMWFSGLLCCSLLLSVDRDPGLINTEDATQSNHAEKTIYIEYEWEQDGQITRGKGQSKKR
jgi:hypothetical protein